MTFSEFINKCSYSDYITYCGKHEILPIFDMKLDKPRKICWLIEKTEQKTLNESKKKNGAHIS
jgi:hypothetical protein